MTEGNGEAGKEWGKSREDVNLGVGAGGDLLSLSANR